MDNVAQAHNHGGVTLLCGRAASGVEADGALYWVALSSTMCFTSIENMEEKMKEKR